MVRFEIYNILKVESTGFSDRLDVQCERNRGSQEDTKGSDMNKQ